MIPSGVSRLDGLGRPSRHRAARLTASSAGLTLVEMMVAITIGLILALMTVQAFVSTRDSSRAQTNLAAMHDSARFAVQYLGRVARMAAYRGDGPDEWVLGPITNGSHGISAITGVDNDADGGNTVKNGTDVLTISYEGNTDGFIRDCLGNAVGAGVVATNTFSVSAANELRCSVDNGVTNQVLLDGVESLQVLYGLDSNADQTANRYVTLANVVDEDDVVSVRIGLLLISPDDNLAPEEDTGTYIVLDEVVYDATTPANDRFLRRVVDFTVQLRNRL